MVEQYKTLVKAQHIRKVISFPNNYFTHTNKPLVLLELSKKPINEIYFIDLEKLDVPIRTIYLKDLSN